MEGIIGSPAPIVTADTSERDAVMTRLTHGTLGTLRKAGLIAVLLVAASPAHATDTIVSWTKLGTGGCRTPSGSHGNFTLHQDVATERSCLSLCAVGRVPCKAVEYNRATRACEVHTAHIDRVSRTASGNATCFVARRG